MQHEFWHEKWRAGELGFHQGQPHPLLKKYWPELALADHSRVLLPLCGKSNDLLMLAQSGHQVLGVELSQIAVDAFFTENGLAARQSEHMGGKRYCTENIELLCGDFFMLNQAVAGAVDAVFDRAALVALPAKMRLDYVNKLRELTRPGTAMLLIAVYYETDEITPPPFVVTEQEIRRLYQDWCHIRVLGEAEAELKNRPALEVAYQLVVR